MRVRRIVCPKCNKETKLITEEDNLHSYSEEIVYVVCEHHPVTPEDKLLKAIFGGSTK